MKRTTDIVRGVILFVLAYALLIRACSLWFPEPESVYVEEPEPEPTAWIGNAHAAEFYCARCNEGMTTNAEPARDSERTAT